MQGSQAGNFRTHLKTDTKTQNTKLLHFFVSRLFILRSCIEFVNNLVTVASEMLTVTINFSKFNSVVLSLLREANYILLPSGDICRVVVTSSNIHAPHIRIREMQFAQGNIVLYLE